MSHYWLIDIIHQGENAYTIICFTWIVFQTFRFRWKPKRFLKVSYLFVYDVANIRKSFWMMLFWEWFFSIIVAIYIKRACKRGFRRVSEMASGVVRSTKWGRQKYQVRLSEASSEVVRSIKWDCFLCPQGLRRVVGLKIVCYLCSQNKRDISCKDLLNLIL